MFYPIVMGLPILFARVRELFKNRFFDIGFIFVMSFLLCMRTGTGYDLDTYSRVIYEWYQSGKGIFDPISMGESFEIGFAIFYYIIARLGIPYNFALFVFAFFNLSVLFYFVDKIGIKNKVFAIIVYVSIFDIYIYSLSAIRQSIAISFYLLSIISLKTNKRLRALLFIILGCQFHWSLIIMLPFLWFVERKKNVRVITLLLWTLVSPFIYRFFMNSNLLNILGRFKYNIQYYLLGLSEERYTNMVNVYIFIGIAIVFSIILATEIEVKDGFRIKIRVVDLNSIVRMDILDWSMFFFLVTKEWLAISYLSALPRVQMYWYYLLPFWLSRFLGKFEYHIRWLIYIVIVIGLILMFRSSLYENADAFMNAAFVF